MFWIIAIFVYYIIATLLPIDKIIGKVYPLFAISLLFMAAALMIGLIVKMPAIPELWDNLSESNLNANPAWLGAEPFMSKNPLFPCLFITIACGAISGFHATQSPLMARCMKSERLGRPIFYGSMITEGFVCAHLGHRFYVFFYYGGWREVVSPEVAQQFTAGLPMAARPWCSILMRPQSSSWFAPLGWEWQVACLPSPGVVAAPITSGDTAFRSARLIIAEAIGLEQHSMHRRLYICIPMFVAAILLLVWQMNNPDGFNVIWQYFGWANQTLSVFTLWTLTVYLVQRQKPFIVTLVPALFMTVVCSTFLLISKQALGLQSTVAYTGSIIIPVLALVWFFARYTKYQRTIHS